MTGPRILISAGEPSGDLHGAAVARALRRRWPAARLYGLGGDLMAEAGVELTAHVDDLAVMGFAEVAGRLPFFLRLLRRVRAELGAHPPDLVLPIDYPGFNLRLARSARERGVPVLYYISPQVWAWHRSRIGALARYTDRLAVILPFEERLFREAGAHASFVGHPLLDLEPPTRDRRTFLADLGIDSASRVLALFPGSRAQEVERHIAPFAAAAAQVVRRYPDVRPVIAVGAGIPPVAFDAAPFARSADSWELLHHADAALVKSGTSTLQAALTLTPMVIAYRMHPLTFAIARALVHVDHVGLANLVAGERIATELLQNDANAERMAAELSTLLDPSSGAGERARERLMRVREALHPDGAPSGTVADRVAALAAELIGDGS